MNTSKELLGTHSSHVLLQAGRRALEMPAGWRGILIERKEIPAKAECGPQFSGMPVVIASRYSPGQRWYRYDGVLREIPMIAPGIDTLSATYERDYGKWECPHGGETICLRLPNDVRERYLQDEAHRFDLDTQYSTKDDQLLTTIFSLAEEMQMGMPNGTLYAEGLSLSIFGLLVKHHAVKKPAEITVAKGLARWQQERIRAIINTELDGDLSIERLANETGISPFHFSRLFRNTFGLTPHRYVMQTRIARAAQLLRAEKERTVADIALEVGFASQAHLTHAFKCQMGETPARWRNC